ncbi:hypothetical protein [Sulfuracidifex tepidarius]|nr:hypothetical protein [Sulfuracidifex tepidarius]
MLSSTVVSAGSSTQDSIQAGSAISYYTSVCLEALSIIKEQGNGTVIQYVTGDSNGEVYFRTQGYGSIYSVASKNNMNLTEYFLMEMYNGSYSTSIGLGSGFPMMSQKELSSLKAGTFTVNGSQATVSTCTFSSPKGDFQAYKVNLVKSESIGTANMTIWVNETNGVILQLLIVASTSFGSATIFSTVKNWHFPSDHVKPTSTQTSTSTNSRTQNSTAYNSTNSTIPSSLVKQLENGSVRTPSTKEKTTSYVLPISLLVVGVAIMAVLSFLAFRRR